MADIVMILILAIGVISVVSLGLGLLLVNTIRQESGVRTGYLSPGGRTIIAVGQAPDEFAVKTFTGATVSRRSLDNGGLVAFFDTDCGFCTVELPRFKEQVTKLSYGREQVIVVITGQTTQAERLAAWLSEVAHTVVEPARGSISTAFRLRRPPGVCALGKDAKVVATSYTIDVLTTQIVKSAATAGLGGIGAEK